MEWACAATHAPALAPGTLIATDDLPGMQVLTTTLSSMSAISDVPLGVLSVSLALVGGQRMFNEGKARIYQQVPLQTSRLATDCH